MAILSELLAPSVVTRKISRIYCPGNYLSRFFGMQIGGPNCKQVPGRSYSWDIVDNVRSLPKGRAPGTGPAMSTATAVARQTNTFPRCYNKLPLDYETISNIRSLGENAGTRDRMGLRYIETQAFQEKLKHDNFREFMVAMALVKGTFSFKFSGDDWIPVKTLGSDLGFSIDYQIPSGNKSTAVAGLNPLGTGNIIDASWRTAGTDIPAHLDNINKAFQQLVGAPLALVITDSTVWNNVLNNTKLQAQGGSVNSVFAEYVQEPITGPDGNNLGIFTARLRARPHIKWLIVDHGLEIDGTYTSIYDGTVATFMVEPNPFWFSMQEGSEPVKENPMAGATDRYGFHSWMREWDEPARVELHTLQNAIPELAIPKGIMVGCVHS